MLNEVGKLLADAIPAASQPRLGGEVIRAGTLILDTGRLEADTGQGPVPLTRLEFLFLKELLYDVGQPVPKERLLARVWNYDFDPGSNVVDVCVRRLRSKLGFELITTKRGKGYQLSVQLPDTGHYRGGIRPSAIGHRIDKVEICRLLAKRPVRLTWAVRRCPDKSAGRAALPRNGPRNEGDPERDPEAGRSAPERAENRSNSHKGLDHCFASATDDKFVTKSFEPVVSFCPCN